MAARVGATLPFAEREYRLLCEELVFDTLKAVAGVDVRNGGSQLSSFRRWSLVVRRSSFPNAQHLTPNAQLT
jgi:hypothetical protein